MVKPSLIVAQVQTARGKLYQMANPSGMDYALDKITGWAGGRADSENAQSMLQATDIALAAMYRQLPAAEEGDPRALRIFATTVENILPTIRTYIGAPSMLSMFVKEVAVGSGKDLKDEIKPWMYLAGAVGVAYIVRTVWTLK